MKPANAIAHAKDSRDRELVIDSRATLQPLADEIRNNLHRRYRKLTLRAPGFSADTQAQWQTRLERDYFACGCAEATIAALAAVAAYLAYRIVTGGSLRELVWLDLAGVLAVFVAGTGIGKAIGRRIARRRLQQSVGALSDLLPAGLAEPEHRRPCGHAP